MVRNSITLAAAGAALLALASASLADSPKKFDPKSAEENLRKAQAAATPADSTLRWLSRAAWVGVVLKGTPEWQAADKFLSNSSKAAADLKKGCDKLVELAEKKNGQPAVQKEAKDFLDKVKLIRLNKQADELDRLAKKVRDLPVGLVSDQLEDKFKVSKGLLVKDPKEAEARFQRYLAAMRANVKFLEDNRKVLEDAAGNAKAAGKVCRKLQEGIEKVSPVAGPHTRALTELYLEFDKLSKAYNELSADCAAKSKLAKKAAETEQKRHDNLKAIIKTAFGFGG